MCGADEEGTKSDVDLPSIKIENCDSESGREIHLWNAESSNCGQGADMKKMVVAS